jgi:NADH-quinone oxidoreductase subunit J
MLSQTIEVAVFTLFSLIAVAGAIGMTTTMSMFRSGLFLMASFVGVAGLFVLLSADLLAWLQVMMYIGGMLVMILFMVLFSEDPGGRMMAAMPGMARLETWFSAGIDPGEHAGMEMDMSGMSMTTPIKRPAKHDERDEQPRDGRCEQGRRPWAVDATVPDPDSPRRVGELLMGKYMMAFEGAGLLILLGIFGAVYLARPGAFLDPTDRQSLRAAVDEPPAPIDSSAATTMSQASGSHQDHEAR